MRIDGADVVGGHHFRIVWSPYSTRFRRDQPQPDHTCERRSRCPRIKLTVGCFEVGRRNLAMITNVRDLSACAVPALDHTVQDKPAADRCETHPDFRGNLQCCFWRCPDEFLRDRSVRRSAIFDTRVPMSQSFERRIRLHHWESRDSFGHSSCGMTSLRDRCPCTNKFHRSSIP